MRKRLSDIVLVCISVLIAIALLRGPLAGPAAVTEKAGAPGDAALSDLLILAQTDGRREPGARRDLQEADPLGDLRFDPSPADVPATLTPERINAFVSMVREIDPERANKLEALRQQNPQTFDQVLLRSRRIWVLIRLKTDNPVLYDLKKTELNTDMNVRRLARAIQRAHQAGRKAEVATLRTELLMAVRVQVAFSHVAREEYVCRLEEHVKAMRDKLNGERSDLERAVEAKMQQLIK